MRAARGARKALALQVPDRGDALSSPAMPGIRLPASTIVN
jgi:hypothetical protein